MLNISDTQMGVSLDIMDVKIHCLKDAGHTVHCRALAVYPGNPIADGKLWFTATAQSSGSSIILYILIVWEMIKILNTVSIECISLFPYHKIEKF